MKKTKMQIQRFAHQRDNRWSVKSKQVLGLLLALCLLVLLAACSSTAGETETYTPEPSDVTLEEWEDLYPAQYASWAESVHGEAYLEGNQDAPGCTDCHADPESGEIETAAFQLDIPNRCARCHSDESIMADYGISTDVYDTYAADYHGTTISYYQSTDPDTYRDEAVCSDCHGSHNVYAVEDERSSVNEANLTATCQKCHHDAPEEFASAFGHYRTARQPVSSDDTPVLFWVKLFYQILLPFALGGMILYILLDIVYRLKKRKKQDE